MNSDYDLFVIKSIWRNLTPFQRRALAWRARWFGVSRQLSKWRTIATAYASCALCILIVADPVPAWCVVFLLVGA